MVEEQDEASANEEVQIDVIYSEPITPIVQYSPKYTSAISIRNEQSKDQLAENLVEKKHKSGINFALNPNALDFYRESPNGPIIDQSIISYVNSKANAV